MTCPEKKRKHKRMELIFYIVGQLLFWLGSARGDLTLFPNGREVEYEWEAIVATGTVLPNDLSSKWDLKATIVVQQQDNVTIFQVKNITSSGKEYNGDVLSLPFQATYVTGDLSKLMIDPDDELWSVNMKKALVSLFQIKLYSIAVPAFVSQEVGLYGACKVEYVVTHGETMTVRKVIDHNSCSRFPQGKSSRISVFTCPNNYQDMIASDSESLFVLTPLQEVLIRNVTATGRTLVQPYQAKSEAHYSRINQVIVFKSIRNIDDKLEISANAKDTDLTYQKLSLDPTYGKAPTDRIQLVNKILELLGELSDSVSTWEVGVKGLDNQTSFQILDLMWWLEVEEWEKLYTTVELGTSYRQETIQHFFWEFVPQVGSKSAALFIKDLVRSGRVKGSLAGRLLVNFPFYLREPSEELLIQCEELLKLGDEIGQDVKNSAVLGFGSLIHKICLSNCITDTIDRYAKLYLDKFTESTTYEQKMLYLQGLSNMELTQALEFFMPIITGQTTSNRHIRFLAMWATLNTVQTDPNKIFEVYWPIFSNRTETLEVRASALTLLISSEPSSARFFSLYWFMQTESSEHLYNFYYTTIKSLAGTNYPCYSQLGKEATKFVRFIPPKSRHWTSGNYILDFEDHERDYGGMLQVLLIASEFSGLPNVFIFMAEQHALGQTRHYTLYLKIEGIYAALSEGLEKIKKTEEETIQLLKVIELLRNLKVPLKVPEDLHVEIIFKVDGKAVISQYINQTTFNNWTDAIIQLSSEYFEFSVNLQGLNFPSLTSIWRTTDLGTPILVQMRASELISARGSISQENGGCTRNAELDLRYSWNRVSSLRTYSPFRNRWYGAERCRNLHIRLPFATQLIVQADNTVYKVTAVKHRGFVAGSRLGMVWHASTRLTSHYPVQKRSLNISDEWTMDSEDLGARLGASVFDCSNPDTLPEALHTLKAAFLANNKNYHMIPGGVVLLGLLSMRDNLQMLPAGGSCGVMLYFSPLLTQVEPVLLFEGSQVSLKMTRQDGLLWEVKAGMKRLRDSNKEVTFKLYRAPSISASVVNIWRVIQLEGAFIVPSRMSGVFNRPSALTGYSIVSWGDAALGNTEPSSAVRLKLLAGFNDTKALYCYDYTPTCLQAASDLATRQTASLQYSNLPTWLKMAAHALFPEHIQAEGDHTQVTFSHPAALLPWNTNGLCAINHNSVLTLDNATLSIVPTGCYSLAVADCSSSAQFSVLAKVESGLMAAKVFCGKDELELKPSENATIKAYLNGDVFSDFPQGYDDDEMGESQLQVRTRGEGVIEVELRSGVVLQHYNTTIVILMPSKFRGYTCGMCGDFNGDANNESVDPFVSC